MSPGFSRHDLDPEWLRNARAYAFRGVSDAHKRLLCNQSQSPSTTSTTVHLPPKLPSELLSIWEQRKQRSAGTPSARSTNTSLAESIIACFAALSTAKSELRQVLYGPVKWVCVGIVIGVTSQILFRVVF